MIGLSILAIASLSALDQDQERRPQISAYVSYGGHCIYWTGDVGLSADQFRAHLKSSIEIGTAITIYHSSSTPGACVRKARKLAVEAGFQSIKTVIEDVIT